MDKEKAEKYARKVAMAVGQLGNIPELEDKELEDELQTVVTTLEEIQDKLNMIAKGETP